MPSEVKLPRLGQGMEAGTITKWLKSEGDTVEKGEPLFEIDTDKVTQEVESDFAGVLLKITLPEGEAPVGQTIAYIGKEGEEVEAEAPSDGGMPQSAEKPAEAHERDPEREEGREACSSKRRLVRDDPGSRVQRRRTAAASRPRRSRAGSRASAASSSPRCAAPAPTDASSPTTSSAARPPRRQPPPPPCRPATSSRSR